MTVETPARRRPPTLVLVPLVVAVIAIVGGVAFFNQPGPEPSGGPSGSPRASGPPAAFPPPVTPTVVAIHRESVDTLHLGYPDVIAVSALGSGGIAGIELWAGGELIASEASPDPTRPAFTTRWEWSPTQAGETVLVARAFDALGRVSQSAPQRVTVVADPPISYQLVEVVALAGETVAEVVARGGGDAAAGPWWNRELPDGPLVAGTIVAVPILEAPLAPTAYADPDIDDAVLVAALEATTPAGLATPSLEIGIDGCTVTTQASGGTAATDGFAFEVMAPVGDTYLKIGTVAPSGDGTGSTSFAALGGQNYAMVTAYSELGTTPSAIVPFVAPPECGDAGWTGDARLDGGRLVFTGTADRAYLYLKLAEGEWQRVPATTGSFVEPIGGQFDFNPVLPALGDGDLEIEAWGWNAGSLVRLGAGTYDAAETVFYSGAIDFGMSPSASGYGTRLDWIKPGADHGDEILDYGYLARGASATRTFQWKSAVPGVTHLQWQILPYPLMDSTAIAPPFLIDSDWIPVAGNTDGSFTLDLKPYIDGTAKGVTNVSAWALEQIETTISQDNLWLPPTGSPVPAYIPTAPEPWFAEPSGVPTSGGTPPTLPQTTLDDLVLLMPPLTSLHVRVIPYIGTQPAGKSSNSVTFEILGPNDPIPIGGGPTPPPTPTYTDSHTVGVKFFPPTGSSMSYYYCVVVVSGGKTLPAMLVPDGKTDWNNGTSHCNPPKEDDWSLFDAFESFVSWVGTAWDYISAAGEWVKNKVVDVVLAFVPCEQLANQVAKDGKDICRTIAKTALNATLVAFGIPPEIPKWSAVVDAAKGDLREFILANAATIPGISEACLTADGLNAASSSFPTCDAMVDKAIDTAVAEVSAMRSKAAGQQANLWIPSGITVEPHPKSMPQPPHFEVTVQRTNAPLPSAVTCSMTGSIESSLANWSWNELEWTNGDDTVVTKAGTVSGHPFLNRANDIAILAPGGLITYEIWLTNRAVWFEPDQYANWYAKQYYEWYGAQHNRAWVLLQEGAVVKMAVYSNCFSSVSTSYTLTGQAWD